MNATVVIAPDSFKGSASAAEIASALAAGWSAVRADDEVVLAPMADGGEGTLDAFHRSSPGAARHPVTVTGPDGRLVETSWLLLPDRTAVVELASTSGISLLSDPAPMEAHTLGFGQAIAAALAAGAERLLLALGGSSSTDGGTGALLALGALFLDDHGQPVPLGGGGLATIRQIDLASLRPLPPGGAHILGDVSNPLLGPTGAAHVYGPQKGATPRQVVLLDAALAHLAGLLGRPDGPGAGAAGGTAYGLRAWGATSSSGASAVGEAIGLPALLSQASVVITGEGRFDSQSAQGKVTQYVSGLAREVGARVLLAAGSIGADTRGFTVAVGLDELAGDAHRAIHEPCRFAALAGARLARVYSHIPPSRPAKMGDQPRDTAEEHEVETA